jgi:hypothetical protein
VKPFVIDTWEVVGRTGTVVIERSPFMTKRPGDPTEDSAGGRAADRLKQFEDARNPSPRPTQQSGVPASKSDEDPTKDTKDEEG